MKAPSPSNLSNLPVRVSLLIEGSRLKDAFQIVSVYIEHALNRISLAELTLSGHFDPASQAFEVSDGDELSVGKSIEVLAGWGDLENTVFSGTIVGHSLQVRESGHIVRITCKHPAAAMTYYRRDSIHSAVTDGDVLRTILSNYPFSAAVAASNAVAEAMVQRMATDWDFMLALCEQNGWVVVPDGAGLKIGKPSLSGAAVLRVALGESIHSFEGTLSADAQPQSVSVKAWDPETLSLLSADSNEPSLNEQGNTSSSTLTGTFSQNKMTLISMGAVGEDRLLNWANAELLRRRLAAVRGSVSFTGNSSVAPDRLIELSGVGRKFNGDAYVSAVSHLIESDNWVTTAQFGMEYTAISSRPDFSYAPAAGALPAIHGLQVGTVKKLSEDPASLFRVQVLLVSASGTETAVWARVASFYASKGAGSGFLPEPGDEVVVGHLEEDARYPIVLGSLYSKTRASPNPAVDENNFIKSLTTRSNLVLSFDDENKVIELKTPEGNSISISDKEKSITVKDQNNNTLKLSADGITLDSNKDLVLRATGNILLNATQKITATAKQDVSIGGMNVALTAQAGLTAKGSATAELSASGQTTVKGGMVMIN